eukprot:3756121-Pyramimonas_sp.AAC.1
MARAPHANCATGILDGAPHGATKRVRGVPKWPEPPPCELRHHGTLGGVRDVPKLPEPPIRTAPLGP